MNVNLHGTTLLRSRWLPITLLLVAITLAALEVVVSMGNSAAGGRFVTFTDVVFPTLVFIITVSFTGTGTFIVAQRPGNRIGWLMILIGLGFVVANFTSDYPGTVVRGYLVSRPLAVYVAWVSVWIGSVYLTSLMLLLLQFPTGTVSSRRWRPALLLGVFGWLGMAVLGAIQRGQINNDLIQNPFGLVALPDALMGLFYLCGLGAMAAAILSLLLRFRTARGDVRQQLKWFTYGATLAIVLLFGGFATNWVNPLVAALSLSAIAALPVFIGIAILRYRLYDIDILINRTLVYGSLTLSLAALYLVGVIVFQALFRAVSGQGSDLAVALSTLVVAALFNPWRHRVQFFIDRRFYRHKYDAVRIIATFQRHLRDEVDLDQLHTDLVTVVQETVQPTRVSLWLR